MLLKTCENVCKHETVKRNTYVDTEIKFILKYSLEK